MTKWRMMNGWRVRQLVLLTISLLVLIAVFVRMQSHTKINKTSHQPTGTAIKDFLKTGTLLAQDKIASKAESANRPGDDTVKTSKSDRKTETGKRKMRKSQKESRSKSSINVAKMPKMPDTKLLYYNTQSITLVPKYKILPNASERSEKGPVNVVQRDSETNLPKKEDQINLDPNRSILQDQMSTGEQIELRRLRKSGIGDNDIDPWLKSPFISIQTTNNETSLAYRNKPNRNMKQPLKPKPKEKPVNHMAVQGIRHPTQIIQQKRVPENLTKEIFIFEVMRESKKDRHSVKDNKCVLLHSHFVESPICVHDPNEDELISATLIKQQTWEPNLLYVTGRILTNNLELKFLDLGCNLGVYTIVAAKLGIDVIAVDPSKQNLRLLTKSLSLGGIRNRVTMLWNAISDVCENVTLNDIIGNVGGSFVETADASQSDQDNFVQAIRIDDLIPFYDGYSVFIKMDIETYEWKALQGAEKFFEVIDVAYVLMEWSYHREHGDGPEIIDFMFKHGVYPHINANFNTQLEKENYESWPDNVLWIKYSNILVD